MSKKLLGVFLVGSVALFAVVGCSAGPTVDNNNEEEAEDGEDGEIDSKQESIGVSRSALEQGGCSMAEIRGWQRACRSNYGGGGIHYCYPGMSQRHMNCEGACAC